MVHAEALTGPGGVVLDQHAPLKPFTEWAEAGRSGGGEKAAEGGVAVRFPSAGRLRVSIERVLTDNAWAYRKGLARKQALADLGATGKLTRPYRPQTNGKAERFNRTLADEWAYQRPYTSNAERTAALADFLHNYNHHRSHTALGGQPPHHPREQPCGSIHLGPGGIAESDVA